MKFYSKIIVLFLLIFLGQETLSNTASTKVNSFRLSYYPDKIRVVFGVTGSVSYIPKVSTDKIVIEIRKAQLAAALKLSGLSKTLVKSVSSVQDGKDLYLTLNVKKPIKLRHFVLTKPNRLVFDLYQIKEKEPQVILKPQSSAADSKIDDLEQALIDKMYKSSVGDKYHGEDKDIESDKNTDKHKEIDGHQEQGASENSNVAMANEMDEYRGKNEDSDLRPVIVVIDPGHGGHDPGAIGYNGTREKHITLAVAKALRRIINKTKGFHAILTRDSDYFIPLRRRLGIAHEKKADMFISIHADAYMDRSAHGISIFALSQRGATSEAARWLAQKENESELGQAMSDKSNLLRSVLIDLAQTATISASLEIAKKMLQELSQFASLHFEVVEQAAFVVLKSPDIPSLLVEVGFLSYGPEERMLRNSRYQEEIAARLANGIQSYFIRRPPPGTYLAWIKPHKVMTLRDSLPSGEAG